MVTKNLRNRIATFVCLLIVMSFFQKCSDVSSEPYINYIDTSVAVYGPYHAVKLPIDKGVKILNPIQLAEGPGGVLYASNQSGEVYTLNDSDGDGLEDEAVLFCNVTDFNLRSPSGFAYRSDTIYIGTSEEIRAFLDINKDGKADTSWTFYNDIPNSQHPYEWTCGMKFGPDGWLYFALSTDSWNAGPSPDPNGYRGSILRISPDGNRVEKVATGIRSVYGLAFNQYGDLFFTDNEGGGNAKEELNLVEAVGFYGHNPKKYPDHDSILGPVFSLGTEVAPAGITFNTGENNFGAGSNDLFVAFYGPGERWARGAVGRVKMEKVKDSGYRFEEYPVADIPKLSAIAFGKNGALYLAHHGVADYWYNAVKEKSGGFYKLVYDPGLTNKPAKSRAMNTANFSSGSVEAGKQLFAEQACSACHSTDGHSELLGPDLKDVGKRFSREEILEEIKYPSRIIKPSMGAMRITKNNGQVFLGRVVNADERQVSLMLVGNSIISIPRAEIKSTENEMKSLMYENLLNALSEEEANSLLDYLVSLK